MNTASKILLCAFVIAVAVACSPEVTPGDAGAGAGGPGGSGAAATCHAADPAIAFSFSIDAPGFPLRVPASADCSAVSVNTIGEDVTISLSCSDGTLVDEPVAIELTSVPSDFVVPINTSDQLRLDYQWDGVGDSWLILYDASGMDLKLAAVDGKGVTDVGDQIAQLSLDVDDTVCPGCPEVTNCWTMPERVSVTAVGRDGQSASVLDASRGRLDSEGNSYDIVVSRAHRWVCAMCQSQFVVLIGAR